MRSVRFTHLTPDHDAAAVLCVPRFFIYMGLDHQKLVYPYHGLNERLTGVNPARVVKEILG